MLSIELETQTRNLAHYLRGPHSGNSFPPSTETFLRPGDEIFVAGRCCLGLDVSDWEHNPTGGGHEWECDLPAPSCAGLCFVDLQEIIGRHGTGSLDRNPFRQSSGWPAAVLAELRDTTIGNSDARGEITPVDACGFKICGQLHD